jgi:hypothetical protein
MKISLKKSFNRWVKGTDGEEFLIDYPTVDQHQHLQTILIGDEFTGNDKPLKYYQYFLKYVIKDWKGVTDEDGKPVKCKLANNELETDLWWSLVSGIEGVVGLAVLLSQELEFTENDKKKFSSQASSDVTTNSQDGEKTTQ